MIDRVRTMNRRFASLFLIVLFGLVAWLGGCVTAPPLPPVSENPAVLALADRARTDADAGWLPAAMSELERALRIEPRNPMLWRQLAQAHFQYGDFDQAESLAARSNSYAGANRALRAANWHLIGDARARRGDTAGVAAALERAKEFER
jgi:tetratricopeptide (TPR) repeat protein